MTKNIPIDSFFQWEDTPRRFARQHPRPNGVAAKQVALTKTPEPTALAKAAFAERATLLLHPAPLPLEEGTTIARRHSVPARLANSDSGVANSQATILPNPADEGESQNRLRSAGPLGKLKKAKKSPPIALLGVVFDHVSLAGALGRIENMIASRRPHYVVTANVDFLVQAQCDEELRRILLDAHLVLCDGTPLVWASRWLGNPLPERVAGSDLVPLLLRRAAKRKYRLFFLGATPEANAQAVANVRAQFPRINLVGNYSPPFRPLLEMDQADIARQIRAAKPDVLLVSFGCPKAEKWIAMHYRSLGVPVVMGVGATIDFLAGQMRRAPRWMQRGGVEWIYRLLQEPRRLFRRYAADLWRFIPAMAAQWWQLELRGLIVRLGAGNFPARSQTKSPRLNDPHRRVRRILSEPTWHRVGAPECLDVQAVQREAALWEAIATDTRHCLLEMSAVRFLDSTGLGCLVELHKRLRSAEQCLVLLDPSVGVRAALRRMGLENFFVSASDAVTARELIHVRQQEQSLPVFICNGTGPLLWQGEITAANAEAVWNITRAEIKSRSSSHKHWTLDLSGVRFIDSAGVALMRRLERYAPREGARVHFVEASESVQATLRLAGMQRLLPINPGPPPEPTFIARAMPLKKRLAALAVDVGASLRRLLGSETFAPRKHERPTTRVEHRARGAV